MKTLIISMPKSGTYLCSNLLLEFGIRQTLLHLNPGTYQQYTSDINDTRKNPQKYTHQLKFEKSIELFGDNEFAVTHVSYNKKRAQLLKNTKKILLVRDEKEIVESYQRWNEKTGRPMPALNLGDIKRWEQETNIFKLSFNDMINKNVEQIDRLQNYLFNSIKFDSLMCIKNAIELPSMTKMR